MGEKTIWREGVVEQKEESQRQNPRRNHTLERNTSYETHVPPTLGWKKRGGGAKPPPITN